MSEITNHKMIVYKFDTDTKNSTSIPSKILTTNRNIFINDSNNQNNNSSLFTNEVLIKNIVNNNTSPYNSFYAKMKPISKKLLMWEDPFHKKTIKNKLLLTNNSSIFLNGTKSYLSKFTHTNGSSHNKTSSNNNIIEKNQNKKINEDNKTESNDKIISKVENDNNKKKKEMKLLKFKLNKILKENSFNICDTFEQRNESFNIKLKNYFKSEKYIKGKEIEKNNLHQNKKGFSSSHNILNYYYEPPVDKKSNEELMACSIINNLSTEERKILSLNPRYFLIDRRKILIKKLNIVLNESLKDRLSREEKIITENQTNFIKEENKTDINNNIKDIYNKNIRKKLNVYNEKKINNKMMEYHQNKLIKDISKKKLIDYVNSGINEYYKKFYSFCHKNYLKYNQYKEGDYYYKMFNYPLSFKMIRDYQLNRNDSRLHHENIFHLLKKQNKVKAESILKKIRSCQNILKNNYNKINNS